jgi:LCP family protein required for cell wall assembly
MTRRDDDREGPKAYKTYKARRPKRSHVDDELAGARPARESRARNGQANSGGVSTGYPERSDKAYRTYGPAPTGGEGGGTNGRGAGTGKPPRRRRRFRWWYVPVGVFAALIIAGVVVTVLAWPGYQKFDRAVDKSNKRIDKQTRAQLAPDDGWIWRNGTTVLLLGVDSKAGEPARSDTIMLMRFDPKSHTVNQLSIPRDTRVDIPGRGYDKINTAMFWGGPALAVETVQDYTGIPINHVVVVDFKGFPRLVNAVGGVDMMVPKTITTTAGSNARTVVFDKGMHHFDGKYAMLYVRIRYADDDFHRASRQQAFVQALQKKIARPSNITRLPEIGTKFMSGVATDLTTIQLIELGYLKWRADGGTKAVMTGESVVIGGVYYMAPPSEATRERMVRRFLGD